MNDYSIRRFFDQFAFAKIEHQIETVYIWNMDESVFQMDVGRVQWVVIPIVAK